MLRLTNVIVHQRGLSTVVCRKAFAPSRIALLHTSAYRKIDTDRSTSTLTQSGSSSSGSEPPPLPSSSHRRPNTASTSNSASSSSAPPPTSHELPLPPSPPPPSARLTSPVKRPITSVNDLPSRFGRNQIIAVPDEVRRDLEDIVRNFKAPVRFGFAYGSGVFRQEGYSKEVSCLLSESHTLSRSLCCSFSFSFGTC